MKKKNRGKEMIFSLYFSNKMHQSIQILCISQCLTSTSKINDFFYSLWSLSATSGLCKKCEDQNNKQLLPSDNFLKGNWCVSCLLKHRETKIHGDSCLWCGTSKRSGKHGCKTFAKQGKRAENCDLPIFIVCHFYYVMSKEFV